MRDSIVFYRSFYEALKDLPPEQFKESVKVIMEYGLNDKEPETEGIEKTIFLLTKPQIDANNKRYQNGTKGGRKSKSSKPNDNQSVTKPKPKHNQTITKAEPNVNDNVNVNDNDNVNDNTSAPDDADASPYAGQFQLNDGTYYKITENDVETFQQLYPGIDVRQELRNVEAWCMSNSKNRKTRGGAKRFLNGWLSRAQNQATTRSEKTITAKSTSFSNFKQRDYDFDELEQLILQSQEASQKV